MKKRIEQLLNGKFIYEQPGASVFPGGVFPSTLKAGETTKGRDFILAQMTTAGSVAL